MTVKELSREDFERQYSLRREKELLKERPLICHAETFVGSFMMDIGRCELPEGHQEIEHQQAEETFTYQQDNGWGTPLVTTEHRQYRWTGPNRPIRRYP